MAIEQLTRRQFLGAAAGAVLAGVAHAADGGRSALGLVEYSLGVHRRALKQQNKADLADPLAFLECAREMGAGGIQVTMGNRDAGHLARVRSAAEQHAMHVEAIVNPPFTPADLDAFEQQIVSAKAAGASVARTVIMPGRRYEQFKSMEEYREHSARGEKALQIAEPVLAKHRFRLAVENHKDHRIDERVAMLKRLGSEWIGACVDVANNLALLEDPLEAVRAFAPWAMTVHIKDQACRECPDGFTIFDAPLGQGLLELPAMVDALRKAKPGVRFNLECITRDAITVPVLAESYWRTFGETRATDLSRTLRVVRTKAAAAPHPAISAMTLDQQLAAERATIEQSLRCARERLGI